MPIEKTGWEIHFERIGVQSRSGGIYRKRTIGNYQVYHDGVAQPGRDMSGMFAEQKGPGNNKQKGKDKKLRIEEGRYPLATQNGTKYKTYDYADSINPDRKPKPGIELLETGKRTEILIHPSAYWLSSIGCINLCTNIISPLEAITYKSSRRRVISVIEDLKAYLGASFPDSNGKAIPRAHAVIDGEPD